MIKRAEWDAFKSEHDAMRVDIAELKSLTKQRYPKQELLHGSQDRRNIETPDTKTWS
jgi:hypothetical protein